MGDSHLVNMGDIKQLHDRISCHAWNGDFTKLALCPNNTQVIIYKKTGDNYEKEFTLEEVRNSSGKFLFLCFLTQILA